MSLRPSSCSVSSLGERGGTVISGVAMKVSLCLQLHFAVLDASVECLDRLKGGERLRPAATEVEQRSVAWALHCTGGRVELALSKRAVVVGAAILDRVQLAVVGVKHTDLAT